MSTEPTTDATDLSIIDEILDIDALLASEIERSERSEILYTKPHLEAKIDALDSELERANIGAESNLPDGERSVGEAPATEGRTTEVIAREIQALRAEYAASGKIIRLRQLPSEDWTAFEAHWKDALAKGAPYPVEMWDDLISKCAIAPELPITKVRALRKKLGHPPLHKIALSCWDLNTQAGVSVPFSRLSSEALRHKRPGMS